MGSTTSAQKRQLASLSSSQAKMAGVPAGGRQRARMSWRAKVLLGAELQTLKDVKVKLNELHARAEAEKKKKLAMAPSAAEPGMTNEVAAILDARPRSIEIQKQLLQAADLCIKIGRTRGRKILVSSGDEAIILRLAACLMDRALVGSSAPSSFGIDLVLVQSAAALEEQVPSNGASVVTPADALNKALEAAQAAAFVEAMPGGLDATLGDGGGGWWG